jgi:hypothetical protein
LLPSDDTITVMQQDIAVIKEKTEQIHRFVDGNGREGARDRLTRVEGILERSARLSEDNAKAISMLQGMIGEMEQSAHSAAKKVLAEHEKGPEHNLKFQMLWLTVKDPKFVLGFVAVILLIIDLASHGFISLPGISP